MGMQSVAGNPDAKGSTFDILRGIIDSNDPMMTGHQILTIRTTPREIPEWTKSDKEIRKVLLRAFPKWDEQPQQRRQAGRWIRIINLYFKLQWTRSQIAEEMELTPDTVSSLIRAIKRAGQGRQANGRGALGMRPRGNPAWRPNPDRPKRIRKINTIRQLEKLYHCQMTKTLWKKLDIPTLSTFCSRNLIRELSNGARICVLGEGRKPLPALRAPHNP